MPDNSYLLSTGEPVNKSPHQLSPCFPIKVFCKIIHQLQEVDLWTENNNHKLRVCRIFSDYNAIIFTLLM